MVKYVNASKRPVLVALIFVVAGILTIAGVSLSCSPGGYSGPVESIIIGTMANAGDTLIFVADEQNYFTENGLNVTLKIYDNGLVATNAMLGGEADLAYATEFIIVGKALQNQKISIITTYSKNETVGLVGRKDPGIEDIQDLKGKRIGLARGTINEFYLGRLLNLNGISIDDVTLVDIKLTELGDSLSSGNVDAVVAGSRNLYPVIQQQGSNVFLWPAHSGQPACGTLVGEIDWVTQHPELVKRLLKSLSEAEQYVNRNPDEAKAAVQKRLNYDDEYMASVWSEYQFYLSLDQLLILAMEDEARWMISNNLTTEKAVPNFLDYIYADALKSVKPGAVRIAGK
jgi:NitT/TauT family transport system substrate-binding protein